MNTRELTDTLTALFGELVDGPPASEAYILNGGDAGLLRSLDNLTAQEASGRVAGGASVAAHADHVRYGLSLMNRWSAGENPFADADWAASWRKMTVTDEEWQQIRTELRAEAHRWLEVLRTPRDVDTMALNGVVGSIVHLAYHLGAIRQIHRATRGPAEPQLASRSA
jgi:hypothetical protein